jgi:hypothetical protein
LYHYNVVLHPGDVLLLDAGPDFHREASHSQSGFALVSVVGLCTS